MKVCFPAGFGSLKRDVTVVPAWSTSVAVTVAATESVYPIVDVPAVTGGVALTAVSASGGRLAPIVPRAGRTLEPAAIVHA